MSDVKNIAILGSGGLGRAAAKLLDQKKSFRLVAMCDREGYAYNPVGLASATIDTLPIMTSVGTLPGVGKTSHDSIGDMIKLGEKIDAIFVALPNLPNEFIPGIVHRFAKEGWTGAMSDALKRSSAVKLMMELKPHLAKAGITYITGAGCTPGLLTAAAALAASSFVEVLEVEVYFGVGIANWESYRATIREDLAHMEGFNIEKANAMSNEEVEEELNRRGGILQLVNMEHADDIMLELAGVVDASKVRVGGIVDTKHARKPVSSRVTVKGRTYDGAVSTHTFTLGDETTMAANVNGTAMGYLNTALWLKSIGQCGVFTAAELMPKFVR
ncbi:saccharopine dehydrogenase-like oxidoreductase [Candidatus Sumerlaeota bacterium]|nr:saccharopine dehydrogenase-like oxidoreductase [Candidatus Sumerlaeota bacterium]